MRSIDVHGLTSPEALRALEKMYADLCRHGYRGKLLVVHGYGSQGKGGVLRTKLRAWMDRQGLDYLRGELAGGNPGTTTVLVKPSG